MEKLIELYNLVLSHKDVATEYFVAFGAIVLSAKSLTIITPTKIDDTAIMGLGKVYNLIAKVLNVAALNIGKDKNADAE